MTRWDEIQQLVPISVPYICEVYLKHGIPIPVRSVCAAHIETATEEYSSPALFTNILFRMISNKWDELTEQTNKSEAALNELHAFKEFVRRALQRPKDLHHLFRHCLQEEVKLVEDDLMLKNMVEDVVEMSLDMTLDSGSGSIGTQINGHQPQPISSRIPPTLAPPPEFTGRPSLYLPSSNLPTAVPSTSSAAVEVPPAPQSDFDGWPVNLPSSSDFLPTTVLFPSSTIAAAYPPHIESFVNGNCKKVNSTEQMETSEAQCNARSEVPESDTKTEVETLKKTKSDLLDPLLSRWTQEQRDYANGKAMPKETALDEYLIEADKLVEKALKSYQELTNTVKNSDVQESGQIIELKTFIEQLAQDIFLIRCQPSQVLLKGTNFPTAPEIENDHSKVAQKSGHVKKNIAMEIWLLAAKRLGLKEDSPLPITCYIVDEENYKMAQKIRQDGGNIFAAKSGVNLIEKHLNFEKRGKTHDPVLVLEGSYASAVFEDMSIIKDFRKGTNQKGVAEKKYSLLFRCDFRFTEGVPKQHQIKFQLWTCTLPVVIVSHEHQKTKALATITFDNAFPKPEREGFEVLETVTWADVKEMLDRKFTGEVGSPLLKSEEEYLGSRLENIILDSGYPNDLSWESLGRPQYQVEEGPGSPSKKAKVSFLEWFLEGMMVQKEHFKDIKRDGHFMGFLGKEESKKRLEEYKRYHKKTFLLRLSCSKPGGVSITWINKDQEVRTLEPIPKSDFDFKKPIPYLQLVTKLRDHPVLESVYPNNVSKTVAFKGLFDIYDDRWRKAQSNSPTGYDQQLS